MTPAPSGEFVDEREQARTRIKKRRDLRTHTLVFLLVNMATIGIWAITDSHGFFWPVFLIVFWGIGLVMNAWDVYVSSEISERDIDREISRMHRR
jgi:heme O synthase-like polyprenyltransferase